MIRTETLVERDDQLHALEEAVAGSKGSGSVVLLSGEAGFGKTSLLRVLVEGLDHRYRVMVASCESVGIPAAFAPLFDLLDELPDHLVHEIRSGLGRQAVNAEMLRLLRHDRVVLILEDMHWADEATLGLARYLGRRLASTGSCLILTYRSEEVDLSHPLRLVIADIGRAAVRLELPALTPAGVGEMAEGLDIDPVSVHAATLGNPFFVEELLRQPTLVLPPTIGDAILARVSQLPKPAHEILFMAALSADGVALDVLHRQGPESDAWLDLAVSRRLLVTTGGQVKCRHDLIRESLLRAVPPALRRALHGRLLSFLEDRAGRSPDIAKLAYHSIGAGESDKARRYSLEAARDAARGGAHRQAAFHFDNALGFKASTTEDSLDVTLLEAAKEHCLINEFETASDLAGRRVRKTDSTLGQGRARAWYSYFRSRENDLGVSRLEASLAVDSLRHELPSEELALALGVVAWVEMVEGEWLGAIAHGDEAVAVARAAGAPDVEVYAATTAGTCRSFLRDPAGLAQVEGAAQLGVALGSGEYAARALNNLGVIEVDRGHLESACQLFDRMIEYASVHELDAWYIAGVATRAWINVASGQWDEADRDLEVVLGQRTCVQTEVESLMTAATLRLRRGDPGAEDLIHQALSRVEGSTDHMSVVMGCLLALEGVWTGVLQSGDAYQRYEALLRSEVLARDNAGRGALAYWARRLDLQPPVGALPGPPGLEWRGAISQAAESWERKGFVVQAAVTRAMVPDADLDSVFADLRSLGAEGVLRGLRRELQRRQVKRIPRGERLATQQNPAGLTVRQAEVLALIVSGMSNAAIADELFITQKTASHHVSAVLTKLRVSSRLQAAALATANGWSGPKPRISN